ncbi:MAG: hypothetical protein F7B06_06090 [Opitutae bacterium]|nr:hypothetical protein [Opitutae bacterium]
MKRLLVPGVLCLLVFAALSIPKFQLALAFFEDAGWRYAKPVFVRLVIDFVFGWVVALVVWLQLDKRPWVSASAFCLSTLIVSCFWITSIQNAPRSFRQDASYLYRFIEAKPLRVVRRVEPLKLPPSTPVNSPTPKEEPGAPSEPEVKDPEEEIEETFYTLMRALKKRDAATVLPLADERTWGYFSELKDLALTADREALEKLKPIDRFQVLALRHIKAPRDIARITRANLFMEAVVQGWFYVGDKPDVRIDFVDLLPGGNQAMADIIVNSVIPDERLEFYHQGGSWKMNLLTLLPHQEEKLMATLRDNQQTEQEFFLDFLERETGKTPSPDIWNPVENEPEQG